MKAITAVRVKIEDHIDRQRARRFTRRCFRRAWRVVRDRERASNFQRYADAEADRLVSAVGGVVSEKTADALRNHILWQFSQTVAGIGDYGRETGGGGDGGGN